MASPLFFESIFDTNTLKRLKKMLTSRNVPPPPFSRFLRNRDPVRNYDPGNWVLYIENKDPVAPWGCVFERNTADGEKQIDL